MNTTTAKPLEDIKVPVRLKLAALWTSVLSCYIYGDFLGLYRPGDIKGILAGDGLLGPTSQGSLLAVAILIAVPAVMIVLSLVLPPRLTRSPGRAIHWNAVRAWLNHRRSCDTPGRA